MKINIIIFTFLLATGCVDEPKVKISLFDIFEEAPGLNCPNGGTGISTGIDANENNILDQEEFLSSKYICDPSAGINSLITTAPIASGDICTDGGLQINFGRDMNNNADLDDDEIESVRFICHGTVHETNLLSISDEPQGSDCSYGGVRISSGMDKDFNGVLDESEVTTTKFICNANGAAGLLSMTAIPAGDLCVNGGFQINTGFDTDMNGELGESEVTQTMHTICYGTNGSLYNKLTRINLAEITGNYLSHLPRSIVTNTNIQFNLGNYQTDSVVLVVEKIFTDPGCPVLNGCYGLKGYYNLDLANYETGVRIPGASIKSDDIDYTSTNDLSGSFPSQSITLGLSFNVTISEHSDGHTPHAWSGPVYLLIYGR
jgi:hypothetical protein